MKKFIFFLAFLLSGVLSFAADVNLTFPATGGEKISSYTTTWTATVDEKEWTIANFNANTNKDWTYIKCGRKDNASTGSITTKAALETKVEKVIVNYGTCTVSKINSIQLEIADNADFTSAVTMTGKKLSAKIDTFTIAAPASNMYYRLTFDCAAGSSNGLIIVNSVTYVEAPASDTVYYVNKANWSAVKVHAWDGTATGTSWPGLDATKADYQLRGADVYYFVAAPGAYGKCIFNNGNGTQTDNLTWTAGKYYYDGTWYTHAELEAPVKYNYYLKHNWAGAGNWTWKQLAQEGETENYSIRDIYGGTGCNWADNAEGNNSQWVESPTLVGNPAKGDSAIFTLNNGAITITKIGEPTPEGPKTYYLKHDWAGAGDWTWKELAQEGETENYSIRDIYGGTGCNWNTQADESGKQWVANPTLVDAPAKGDSAIFVLNNGAITITKIATVSPDPEPETVVTKDTVYYVAGTFTNWATGMQALPYTATLEKDAEVEFKQVRVITTTTKVGEAEPTSESTTDWFGQTGDGAMTRESNAWKLDGGNNVKLTTDAAGDYTFALVGDVFTVTFPALPEPEPEPEPEGCDWANIAFLGDGAQGGALSNTYKICVPEGVGYNNIQHPGFATKDGIYVTFPAGISACSLGEGNYDIQGAGIILHIDALTQKYNELTVTAGQEYSITVYNEKGADGPAPVVNVYGIYVNGTTFVAGTKNADYTGDGEEWQVEAELNAGDRFVVYNNTTKTGWVMKQDEYSQKTFAVEGEQYVVADKGTYTLYLKLIYENDNMYVAYTEPVEGCDWKNIPYLGDGAQGGALSNTYKICVPEGVGYNNIQHPGFATKDGIYVTFPVGISACSLGEGNYDIQGAGIILHIDALGKKYNVLTVTAGSVDYELTVLNEKGTEAEEEPEPTGVVFTVTVPAETPACYIVGNITDWAFVAMTPVAGEANIFSITLEVGQDTAAYKYTCGEDWNYVEKDTEGKEIADRTYNANDVVAMWNKVPGGEIDPEATYYIKYQQSENAEDWAWAEMTPNEDKSEWTYTIASFYGAGVNINTKSEDANASWYGLGKITGDVPATGDNVTLTYTTATEALAAKKNSIEPDPETVVVKDTVMYVAGSFTEWAAGMQALPYTVTLEKGAAVEFKQVRIVTITTTVGEAEPIVAKDTTWFGQAGVDGKMTRESSAWTLDGQNNVLLDVDATGEYTFALVDGVFTVTYPALPEPEPEPETVVVKDTVMYVAGSFTNWAAEMKALPYTVTLEKGADVEFKHVRVITTTTTVGEAEPTVAKDTTWYGEEGEGYAMTRGNSAWTLNGQNNVLLDVDATGEYTFALVGETFTVTYPEKGEEPDPEPEVTYYIKNCWNGATDWTWEAMTANEDGTEYTYTGIYGGTGININTEMNDETASWFTVADMTGDKIKAGDEVKFTYNVADKTLTATIITAGEGDDTYYIKNNWNGATDWTWETMTPNEDGTIFTFTGIYGGTGVNINDEKSDVSATWFAEEDLGGIKAGDNVTFTYDATTGELSVKNNSATALELLLNSQEDAKLMIDGQLYIIRSGKVFNACGQLVK